MTVRQMAWCLALSSACLLAVIGACSDDAPVFATGGGSGTAGSTGSLGSGGSGGSPPQPCMVDGDCLGESTVCGVPKCMSGTCGMKALQDAGPVASQVYGDCQRQECDDAGNLVAVPDPQDLYSDALRCTTDACASDGTTKHTPLRQGTPPPGGGCLCVADGFCVECIVDTDCGVTIPKCVSGKCVPVSCTDATKNDPETDVDCGGPDCVKCNDGKSCEGNADCVSGKCDGPGAGNMICQPAACDDGVKNGAESDVDCGVACNNPCLDGQLCGNHADCESGVCYCGLSPCGPNNSYECLPPTCTDGTQNGDETGIDCGGPDCVPCPQ